MTLCHRWRNRVWSLVLSPGFTLELPWMLFFHTPPPRLIYFCLPWVFVAVHGLSLVVASKGYSSFWCMGFPMWWPLLLRSTGSGCASLSSCNSWAQRAGLVLVARRPVALGHVESSQTRIEPMSPALAGGILTTGTSREVLPGCFKCTDA